MLNVAIVTFSNKKKSNKHSVGYQRYKIEGRCLSGKGALNNWSGIDTAILIHKQYPVKLKCYLFLKHNHP